MNIKTQRVLTWIKISSVVFIILFAAVLFFGTAQALMGQGTQMDQYTREVSDEGFIQGLAYLGAGVAGIGLLGAGVGQGYAAGKAAEAVGRNPEAEGKIRNMMIVGAAIAESSALYALVIAILLIFVV